jgi:hypothetical protein
MPHPAGTLASPLRPPGRDRADDDPRVGRASQVQQEEKRMAFAIKAEIHDPRARTFVFPRQRTMYGGKRIAEGDTIFVFASENEGGQGLVARGTVTSAEALPRKPGVARQTPAVSITVRRDAIAKRPLGRSDLKPFTDWKDGQPKTELNFKFYRQATNKIVGISDEAAAFLGRFF